MTKTQRKYLNLLIKVAIVALAMWFVVSKVNNQKNLAEFKNLMQTIDPMLLRLVLAVVVLFMFINWFLEVVKWRYLSRRIEPLGLWKAIKSVLWAHLGHFYAE